MIAGTSKGEIIAKYVKIMPNPSEIISLYDYLDNLMVNDKVVYNYLKESSEPVIGFSVPVLLIDGVPCAKQKDCLN